MENSLLQERKGSNMRILDTIQENVQYRVNSLRAMVMGTSNVAEAEPLSRRREIMRRRREAVSEALGDEEEHESVSTSHSVRTKQSNSGTISQPESSYSSSNSRSRGSSLSNSTPSMSEINKGTLERARERGYQG